MNSEKLHEKAKYTELNSEQIEKVNKVREAFSKLYECIDDVCKPGRETSLVYTKLEEAQMWANKGISREKGE